MALHIEDQDVEALAAEIAALTGESTTEAIRRSLLERKKRLPIRIARPDRKTRLERFLELEVWPLVPPDERGRRLSKEEEEAILGDPSDRARGSTPPTTTAGRIGAKEWFKE